MGDSDTVMLLNIDTTNVTSKSSKSRKRSTDVKARIKQVTREKFRSRLKMFEKEKRKERKNKQKLRNQLRKTDLNNSVSTKRKLSGLEDELNKRQKVTKPEQQKTDNKQSNKNVISSLFRNNPEIPAIPSSDIKQKEENLFTKKKFSELPLHEHLISCLEEKMCLADMTEVQQRTIPLLISGCDVMVKSQTGSGKTLSYAVPMIQKMKSRKQKVSRSDGVRAVILVPTRELALQSLAVIRKLVQCCIWVVPGVVMGGESKKSEKARLRKGVNILIATPGRLVDHINSTNCLSFNNLEWLIIDEADRLLDMGFEKDISHIMNRVNEQCTSRQTALLSATLSSDVQRLASIALNDPQTVDIATGNIGIRDTVTKASNENNENKVKNSESNYVVPSHLKQHYVIIPGKLRLVALASFILGKCKHSNERHKLIVFMSTQEVVQFHYNLFNEVINSSENSDVSDNDDDSGDNKTVAVSQLFNLYALHGDMEQKYRTKVFELFSSASSGVLLCTDVASRGLDLPEVDWIVQLSPPASTAEYVHRVGRTARIGSHGNSLLFLLPSEVDYVKELNNKDISPTEMKIDTILKSCLLESDSLPRKSGSQRAPHTVQEAATALQQAMEEYVNDDRERLNQARTAYQSFIRSYATFPSKMKHIFHIKHLHLGHIAKSFCLREAPSGIGGSMSVPKKKSNKKSDRRPSLNKTLHRASNKAMLEFSSGL